MFVSAGLQTATTIFDKHFPDKRCLVNKYIQKGLASFGRKLGKKYPSNYINGFLREYETFKNYHIEKYIDSGGYQIATLQIPKEFIYDYIRDYTDFLKDYSDIYDFAFSLDIPNNENYSDKEESIKLNRESTEAIIEKAPLDKILFVLQFRTLDLYETWEPLIEDYLHYFKNFAIGGLVVAQPSMKLLPFNFTAIGIGTFLAKWKDHDLDKAKFHVLGNSTYKDVIYYMLLENHIKNEFGINLIVTYDSSNLFKKFQIARFFTYWDEVNNIAIPVSAKEDDLNNIIHNGKTPMDIIKHECKIMAQGCDIDITFPDKLYQADRSFQPEYRPFTLLLEGYEQNKFEHWAREQVSNLYPLYRKDKSKFTERLTNILSHCNKQPVKQAQTMTNTLDFLSNDITIEKIKKIMKNYSFLTDSESFDKPSTFNI